MSFYGDMAETVVELLEEFGAPVVFGRNHANFSDVTNKPISGGLTEYTTTGIVQRIASALVDGTRIRAGDKWVIIVPNIRPEMSDKVFMQYTDAEIAGIAPGTILSAGVEGAWSIFEIEEINPAGTVLAFRVRVRR